MTTVLFLLNKWAKCGKIIFASPICRLSKRPLESLSTAQQRVNCKALSASTPAMDEARKRVRCSSSSSSSSVKTDRLSNLPEHLLHHVLSFLDMKYVLQTSLLSRKWRYIWTSLPFLSFDTDVFQESLESVSANYRYRAFVDFVEQVLLLRDHSTIQTFHLTWDDELCNSTRIDSWIRVAIWRNVQQLHLLFHPTEEVFDFPLCLFTSKSLTSLKLNFPVNISDNKAMLPNQMSLSSLTTLHLISIDFSLNGEFFDKLFSGCPGLETLILVGCNFLNSKIRTTSLQLKHLVVEMCSMVCDSEEKFVVYAPNLVNFSWRDFMWAEFSLESLSSLEIAKVYIEVECSGDDDHVPILKDGDANRMIKCLKELYNVKYLTLSASLLQVISELPSELENWPTPFSNLRHLHLETWLTRGCFRAIMFLLANSLNVETLVLQMEPTQVNSANIVEHGVEPSLKSKLYHLNFVELRNVAGCSNELEYMKVLLENAVALKKMTIFTSRRWTATDERLFKVFTEEVLTIPPASSNVTINFC